MELYWKRWNYKPYFEELPLVSFVMTKQVYFVMTKEQTNNQTDKTRFTREIPGVSFAVTNTLFSFSITNWQRANIRGTKFPYIDGEKSSMFWACT